MQVQALDVGSFRSAQNDGMSTAGGVRTAKLAEGAHQFEAMMLEQMLKSAHFGQAPGAEDDESGGAGGTLQGYGTEALAKAVSVQGGFGIARRIIEQVTAEEAAKSSASEGSKVS